MDFVDQASELQPMLSTNKVAHAGDSFSYRVYMCQVTKLPHMYVIGLIILSVIKTTKHTRLYPATHHRGEGKNGLKKRRDFLVSDRDQQRFFIIIIT